MLREPSVVAKDVRTNKTLAVGEEARQMLGRTPSNIQAIRPLRDGVIADFEVTEAMLNYFIKKVTKSRSLFETLFRPKPSVVICVPAEITSVEERAVRDAARARGREFGRHHRGADGGGDRRRACRSTDRRETWSSTSAAGRPTWR